MTYTKKMVDVTTGAETFEPYTAEEIAEAEAAQAQAAIVKAEREAAAASKDAARQAVLDKLGLSVDEVAALLG